jgi:hypothetical protein
MEIAKWQIPFGRLRQGLRLHFITLRMKVSGSGWHREGLKAS